MKIQIECLTKKSSILILDGVTPTQFLIFSLATKNNKYSQWNLLNFNLNFHSKLIFKLKSIEMHMHSFQIANELMTRNITIDKMH